MKFAQLEEAERFVQDNFPSILMPALYAQSDFKRVTIDFAAPPITTTDVRQKNGQIPHDGMRDVGTPANGNRVLLLRQVDASASATLVIDRITQEISRLVGRPGESTLAVAAVSRLVHISDKTEEWSWGIFFVELATAELATALLQFLNSPISHPSGFRIANVPVAVSFGSSASFAAIDAGLLGGPHIVPAGTPGGIGPFGTWVAYWHPQGSAKQTVPTGVYPQALSEAARGFLGSLGLQQSQTPSQQSVKVKKRKEQDMMVPIEIKDPIEEETKEDADTILRSRSE